MTKNLNDVLIDKMSHFSTSDNYVKLMTGKCNIEEYEYWINHICVNFSEFTFLNDTTGQNISYTCFYPKQRKEGEFILNDFLFIEKSAMLDVFTIYIKSEVKVNHAEGMISYPTSFIISPISVYKDFFYHAITLILSNYPNALFYVQSKVKSAFPFKVPAFDGIDLDYYKALFGYQSNILDIQLQGDFSFNHRKWVSEYKK